jgi:hypothetical protein
MRRPAEMLTIRPVAADKGPAHHGLSARRPRTAAAPADPTHEERAGEGLPDQVRTLADMHFGAPVTGAHREALSQVEFGERHLVRDEVHDRRGSFHP